MFPEISFRPNVFREIRRISMRHIADKEGRIVTLAGLYSYFPMLVVAIDIDYANIRRKEISFNSPDTMPSYLARTKVLDCATRSEDY